MPDASAADPSAGRGSRLGPPAPADPPEGGGAAPAVDGAVTGSTPGGPEQPAGQGGSLVGATVGALGIVFGDIGTSPLYSVQTVFSTDDSAVPATATDVYGVVSMIFWSLTLVVTVKYVLFVMRADNDGEGGIIALAALVQRVLARASPRRAAAAMLIGVLGASLFYGDSVITPAISVLSAVEGLEIVDPGLADLVLPVGLTILTLLFAAQRWGTGRVGTLFGPVMLLWFGTLAVLGIPHVLARPDVLWGLSPTNALAFVADRPFAAFIALGAVVLTITGAEALYADMGHFGRLPIRMAWLVVAFPALIVNYLGQAALLLGDPTAVANPFYLLAPGWARLPLVVLATFATVIASQAVISGAFSLSNQAMRLGFLPRLTVRHTSRHESGQIYVPSVNWLLFLGVVILIVTFESSARLTGAYGLAVTGTFLLTTTLFLMYARAAWRWSRGRVALVAAVFGGVEVSYLAANLTKITHGAWLPLLIAGIVVTVMTTWRRGYQIITARRLEREGPLPDFVERLRAARVTRVPGNAIFPHSMRGTAPLALRANVEFNRVLHERVVIVSVLWERVPHVPAEQRVTVEDRGHAGDGIVHLSARFGFRDRPSIPAVLRQAAAMVPELRDCDPDSARYFLSRITIQYGRDPGMSEWRKRLFVGLSHNAAAPAAFFDVPVDRTVVMGTLIEL